MTQLESLFKFKGLCSTKRWLIMEFLEMCSLVQFWTAQFTSILTLGKLQDLPVPQFFHL